MVAAVAVLFCFCLLPTIVLYYDFITIDGQVTFNALDLLPSSPKGVAKWGGFKKMLRAASLR